MQLELIKDTARLCHYPRVVTKKRDPTDKSIQINLKRLMKIRDWTQVKLAAESGVSQTHISAILRGDSGCTTEMANELAKPFNLNGWHLLIPNLPDELVNSPSLHKLVDAYLKADAAGREFLDAAAERELKRP